MMGPDGIREATGTAILSANYVAARLKDYWPVLYTGARGRNAHECIFDLRALKGRFVSHGRGRGETADRLRLPRADALFSRARDADVRADRKRAQGGARPLLRRDDRDPR